jgi:RNA polymerase sigma-B factor
MANETSTLLSEPAALAALPRLAAPGQEPGAASGASSRRPFDAEAAQRLADAYAARRETSEGAELRTALILELTPLVESVARKFAGCAEPVEDLVGEGFVGLIQAVDGYESGRGARISTYATHRVAGQIKHYLRDRGKIIREPAWLQETTLRLTRAAEALQQDLGRRPTVEEIAACVNLTEEAVQEIFMHRNTFQVLSITSGSGEADEDEPFAIDTEKIRNLRYESLQLPLEDRIVLERLLGQLRDLERRAITSFFFQDLSQSDIARSLGISCNYAGYLLRNGLDKLRKWLHTEELRDAQLATVAGASAPLPVIDPGTEFYNGRYFRSRLIEEASRAQRYHLPLSIVLLQVDAPGADYRELAIAFRQCLRKADIPCRTGEHEFAVILPATGRSVETVARRLQRLATQITGAPVRYGTAIWPDTSPDAAALEERARSACAVCPARGVGG